MAKQLLPARLRMLPVLLLRKGLVVPGQRHGLDAKNLRSAWPAWPLAPPLRLRPGGTLSSQSELSKRQPSGLKSSG